MFCKFKYFLNENITYQKNINGLRAFQEAFAVVVGFTTIFGLSIVPEFVVRQRI